MQLSLAAQMAIWSIVFTTFCRATIAPYNATGCRCFPGDACWPSTPMWAAFNETVGGKLVATVPLASVCHDSEFGSYDAQKCSSLRSNWFAPETHLGSVSSIMAPLFTNDSCNLFLPQNAPCTLGNLVSFAVNATDTSDYQKTIAFAQQHNIRLVIRNTGHDYNGKSTGAGGLAIWTHYMKNMTLVDYKSPTYSGKAVKMGAGVEVLESYQFAHSHGLVSVGGDCPTVGVVGGWSQGGGGHGPGVSKFGMGAEQALEWEVVTGTGDILIANRERNQDLYWALNGGGGGTYGVVSSLTTKVYPDLISSAAALSFSATSDPDLFWDAIQTWQASILSMTESGCFLIWSLSSATFSLEPGNCPGLSKKQTTRLFEPVLGKLKQNSIPYNFSLSEYPNFLDSYTAYNLAFDKTVSEGQVGSRLIPKALLLSNNTELVDIFRKVVSMGAVMVNTAVDPRSNDSYSSVNPARRLAAFNAIFATEYDQTNYTTNLARADEMTYKLLPMIEALTPNGAAYLNECDFQQPNFQEVLYGVNYPRLLEIKEKYDPYETFYALQAVGSEKWYEDQSQGGRLCPVA